MDALLNNALQAIHNRTNVSTGLTHPNDKNAAKELFLRLHNAGVILLATEISSWAQEHGWAPEDAGELGALAQQIGMGKRVRISDGPWWNEDIIEILKNRTC